MNKVAIVLLLLTAIVCLAPTSLTQTATAPPQQTQSPQPAPVTQEDVIRVSTELVQTDVTVIDKQGRFVDGLNRDDFELRVNGQQLPIAFFERVMAGSNRETELLTSIRTSPTGSGEKNKPPSVAPSMPTDRGRTTFLFVDDHHLASSSMVRTRALLLDYVDNLMGPKDQAVIATASGQLGFLQQITGDRDVLHLAINRLTYRPFNAGDTIVNPPMNEYQAVAIENGDRTALSYFIDRKCQEFREIGRGPCAADVGMTNNAVFDDAVARNRGGSTSGTSPGPAATDPNSGSGGRRSSPTGNILRSEAERQVRSRARMIAQQAAQVTLGTLGSLESLVRISSSIRERKLVVFISDGFFLNYLRSTNAYDLRRIADAALRSGTVIYAIDARGLVAGSIDASTKDGFDTQGRTTSMALTEVTAAQDPLHALANDTGGRALLNTNDLQKSLSKALQETSAYYLLAWRPENTEIAKDPFRRIEVKVKDRPDLAVRVRTGFFAEDPSVTSKGSSTDAALSVDDQLMEAIRAGYPRRGVPLAVSLGYLDKPDDGLTLAASIQIERPASNTSASAGEELDLIGSLIDDKGNILSSLKQKVTIAAGQSKNADSMIVTLQFPKVAPGLRQVRIAARDSRSGIVGSTWQWIDVPDVKNAFSLSSVFLSEGQGSISGSQKVVLKPDARFTKTQNLRFQTYVYRAASPSNVSMQLELRRGSETIVQTPPSPVNLQGVNDLTRIPIVGEFPLSNFEAGVYQLKLVVTDQSTKKTASQQTAFFIQ